MKRSLATTRGKLSQFGRNLSCSPSTSTHPLLMSPETSFLGASALTGDLNSSSTISLQENRESQETQGMNSCDISEISESSAISTSKSDRPKDCNFSADNRRKIQSKMNSFQTVTAARSEKITQHIANMIAVDSQPFSIVEDKGFNDLISLLAPGYKMPSRRTVKARVDVLMSEMRREIVHELGKAKYLSITTDTWTSCHTESYITLTAHYIDSSYNIGNCIITVVGMPERHTAVNLAGRVDEELESWHIKDRVKYVVHDNASNIVAAMEHIDSVTSVPCAAHTLQLSVNAGLAQEVIGEIIRKCTALVSHFNHSCVAYEELRKWQDRLNLPKHRLIQCVKTRWNSVYFMLERLRDQKPAIEQVLNDDNITTVHRAISLEITGNEWRLINDLVVVLKPLQVSTTVLCSETTVTSSMVLPVVDSLVSRFLQEKSSDATVITEFKRVVACDLRARFKFGCDALSISPLLVATFLDPRYKMLTFVSKTCKEFVRNNVLMEMMEFSRSNPAQDVMQSATSLDYLFGETDEVTPVETDPILGNEQELMRYEAEPQIGHNENPLIWWQSNQKRFEILATMVPKYFSIPATSVPSERVFSTCGNVVTDKRSRLNSETVGNLVFINYNSSKRQFQ